MKKIFSAIIILSMVFSLSGPSFGATSFTWNGGGGANTSLDNGSNWVGGLAPTIPSDTVTFAVSGSTASVVNPAEQNASVTFNSSTDFTITSAGGVFGIGNVTPSTDGITAQNPDTTSDASLRTYTISAPVLLYDSQIWTVSNNGVNTTTLAVSGAIGDNGNDYSLTKAGTGTLVLSGANTYSGMTIISGGTLQIGNGGTTGSLGTGNVTNDANLTFDLIDKSIVSNVISGTGTLTQNGTGILALNRDNTYSGGTLISAGTLQVENANALGTGAVVNNATLAIGTTGLILGNTYTQNVDSTLDLTANSSSSYGKITPTALTVFSGSTVNVTVGGYIPNNATLEIINTGTAVTGSAPATVNTNESGTAYYTPRVSFTSSIAGDDLILTADHSSTGFASLASNSNARAAGAVLDNETNPSRDMTNVLNTLEFLSNTKTTAALNSLDPIVDRGVLDNSTAALNNFIGASMDRVQNVLTSTGVSSGDESKQNSIWAKQYGSYLDQGTREGFQGYDAWNTGTAVGLDHMFTDNLTMGASLGYAYGVVNSDANNASTDMNSAQGTVYAGYQGTNVPVYVDLAGYFAHNWYEGQRDISVGPIGRVADSDYGGQQSGAYLEGGYKFDLGDNLKVTPLASLQYTHLSLGSYNETNADSLDLLVNRQSYNILESGLGASIAYPVKYGWGNFTPEVHAKWLYDFIDDDMAVTSAYTGGGGSFTTTGASPARDGANVGGKLTFDFKNDISVIAGVDTELRDQFFGVSGTITVRYKF